MRLKDRVCLITGGAAGIGKATALKFAAEGAQVIICDVNEEVGRATAAELGPAAAFYKVNVADRAAVQVWVDAVVEKYGRVDVLVNNAGIVRDNQLVRFKDGQLVKQMPEADFDLVIAINLKGVFNCTQAVAPVMIKQGSGVILNASSVVGLDGNFGQTNYVATKAGVIGMTNLMANELAPHRINVNAIAPGYMATDNTKALREDEARNKAILDRIPAGRWGTPEDLQGVAVFLASAASDYMSGYTVAVDGGWLAR